MGSPALSGEGRTRTGDTPVFSRVLYQLSYLAAARQCSRDPRIRAELPRPGGEEVMLVPTH